MINYLIINEFGELFLELDTQPIKSIETQQILLKNLKLTEQYNLETHLDDQHYIVEAFDHPLIGHKLIPTENGLLVETQSQLTFTVNSTKLSLDTSDRICGLTQSNVPFRLTERAQDQLFDACDEFDDDSFTLNNTRYLTPPYYFDKPDIQKSEYWTQVYHDEKTPGWDLGEPAAGLKDMLPRLKLPKSRILILGCGEGHDAALFAEAGHVVTAIDFSEEAIARAKRNYAQYDNIQFICQDIFKIPHEWNFSFDIIVEHTCFCAINPSRRSEMVKLWRRLLHEEGQIMAVFFAMLKRPGPPYGSTEWEIRQLLEKNFQFLFWGRLRISIPRRLGRELFVLAKKL